MITDGEPTAHITASGHPVFNYPPTQETVDAIAATRAAGGRVIAVGTTSMRALEAAAQEVVYAGRARRLSELRGAFDGASIGMAG